MKIKSIFIRLFLYFLIFTVIMVGVLWLVQIKFLPQYYYNERVKIMEGYGKEIKTTIERDGLNDTSLNSIQDVIERINGRVVIYNKNGQMIYNEGMTGQLRGTKVPDNQWDKVLSGRTISYHVNGTRGNLEFLVVVLSGEEYVYLIQTHLQTIEEAISITRGFYIYLLGIGFITALILATIFSKRLINPLVKLNSVAREMSQLNLDIQWDDNRSDEIGQLGQTLNFLTNSLKNTISQLESELEKEKGTEKMRREFVARVSHELQTPIALISGYIEAIEDNIAVDKDERKEYFEIIEDEIHKMSRLVREMLDLGQLESGGFKINVEAFDYEHLINKTLGKFDLIKKEKQLKIDIQRNTSNYMVLGDEYRIEQVLTNLLQNAFNHVYYGGQIKIIIMEKGSKIWTGIYNSGERILEKDIPYVWESFYKGETVKTGTGLGLAIAKNVLDLHGSDYGVENTDNGVSFFFDVEKKEK